MSPLGTDGPEGMDEIAELMEGRPGAIATAEAIGRARVRLALLECNPMADFGPARAVRDHLRVVVDNQSAAALAGLQFEEG